MNQYKKLAIGSSAKSSHGESTPIMLHARHGSSAPHSSNAAPITIPAIINAVITSTSIVNPTTPALLALLFASISRLLLHIVDHTVGSVCATIDSLVNILTRADIMSKHLVGLLVYPFIYGWLAGARPAARVPTTRLVHLNDLAGSTAQRAHGLARLDLTTILRRACQLSSTQILNRFRGSEKSAFVAHSPHFSTFHPHLCQFSQSLSS